MCWSFHLFQLFMAYALTLQVEGSVDKVVAAAQLYLWGAPLLPMAESLWSTGTLECLQHHQFRLQTSRACLSSSRPTSRLTRLGTVVSPDVDQARTRPFQPGQPHEIIVSP